MPSRPRRATLPLVWLTILLSASLLTGASLTHPQEPTQAAPPSDGHPEFPAGAGRDTTLATCSKCHSPNNILAMGRDRQGWQDLVLKMVDLGAQGTDDDFATIVNYLTASFPPVTKVNVNTATAPQIATTLGLTTDESKAVVAYREKNGNFKTIADLKLVPNLDPKKLQGKESSIAF